MRAVLFTASALALVLVAAPASAERAREDGGVVAATIDAAGAEVRREAHVRLNGGAGQVRVDGLPVGLKADSVQVQVLEGRASVDGVSVSQVAAQAIQGQRRAELEAKLEALQAKSAEVKDRVHAAQVEISAIERLADKAPEVLGEAGDWTDGLGRLRGAAGEAFTRKTDAERERARLGERIQEVRANLANLGGGPGETRVDVDLSGTGSERVKVAVDYRMNGARWRPVYDVSADTRKNDVAIERRARVTQTTGLDWTDVGLELSTQRPHDRRGVNLPRAWWVDFRRDDGRVNSLDRALSSASPEAASMKNADMQVRIAGTPYAVRYVVDGRVDIPSGGDGRLVELGAAETTVEMRTRTVPATATAAYLVAEVKNAGEAPLLEGQARLFRDGAFVGRVRIPAIDAGARGSLDLGRDPLIEVSHETLTDEGGESGIRFVNDRKTRERAYSTRIRNNHDTARTVRVVERMPAPRHEEIEVDLTEATPRPDVRDLAGRRGVLAWDIEVPAGGARTLEFGYTLSWPKDKKLPGF